MQYHDITKCKSYSFNTVKQVRLDATLSECMPPPHNQHSHCYLLESYALSIL